MDRTGAVEDFLLHFGVKGMRWGQRKADRPVSAEAGQKAAVKAAVKKDKVASVSNAQLRAAIERMRLEQDFKRLQINEQPALKRFVTSTLTEIGKREVQAMAARKVAGVVAKKVATGGLG